MTTPFNPKNPNKTSILTRAGVPEYTKLHAAAYPTPPAADIGVELEVTDTGDRYRWTGSLWVQTLEHGSPLVVLDEVAGTIINTPISLDGTPTTLTANATAGTNSITVASTAGISIGSTLKIYNAAQTLYEYKFPKVLNIVGLVLTLDHPLDNSFSSGDIVCPTSTAMNVVGTLASPITFKLIPTDSNLYHITKLVVTMTDATAGDLGTLGGMAAVTNGIVFRVRRNSKFLTLGVWKANSDLANGLFTVQFDARSGGGGAYGVVATLDLVLTRSVLALDGTLGDRLEILIQDNMTGLISMAVLAQGHIV